MHGDVRRPAGRTDGLIVERLPGELLVYDEERDEAHCLHGEAAAVFDLLDGTCTTSQIAALASLSEARVEEVLTELGARHLLDGNGAAGDGLSRRDLIQRGALTGAGVAGAALITSIAAPLPAAAQSPGGDCDMDSQECVGDCGEEDDDCGCIRSDGVTRCVQEPTGGPCQTSSDCPSNWYCANDPCFETYSGGEYFQHCAPGCQIEILTSRAQSSRRRSWLKRR
jgi:hypothetical protein